MYMLLDLIFKILLQNKKIFSSHSHDYCLICVTFVITVGNILIAYKITIYAWCDKWGKK